ncbi:MAG: serine protease [Bdellovibrionales bacterium]
MKLSLLKTTLLMFATLLVTAACSDEPANPAPGPGEDKASAEKVSAKVVYGRDDRLDLHQVDVRWKQLASATAALIRNNRVNPRPGQMYAIKSGNFGRDYNLCENEPFRDQGTSAFCSGFLVGPDLMVTAGHCIRSSTDCTETAVVFGFGIHEAGQPTPEQLPASQVYRCFSVVKTVVSPTDGVDYAVIRLDRPVRNVTPLTIRSSAGTVDVGTELAVIGHPVGLPTKVAGGAIVRTVNAGFLIASLDTYGGNSGSAVFNVSTGEVEGILVRGETDFKYQGSCRVSNTCDQNGCRGEDVTRIEHVRAALGL